MSISNFGSFSGVSSKENYDVDERFAKRIKVNLDSVVKFALVNDPEKASEALNEYNKLDELYKKMTERGEAARKASEEQKINGIIYQNNRALFFFYEDGSMSIPNAFSSKLSSAAAEILNNNKITTKEKMSLTLRELGLKESDFGSYDFSQNSNGPRVRDSLSVVTEKGLEEFLKSPSKRSTLPNPGLGGRLSGFTGIEVMERSQMLDRVKTAG